jgi:Zn-dependent protease
MRLGRLWAIEVDLDWSWAFIFGLMVWELTHVFLGWHPTWRLGASVFLAIATALLFFASIVAHELAHALVARIFGMEIKRIHLFLLGGISDLEREPVSARAEFWMAIAGPLASLVFGTLLLVAASTSLSPFDPAHASEQLAALSPLMTLTLWVASTSVVLAFFNLVPAFPLDGGRVLRAMLWYLLGDRRPATVAAASIGRAIGWSSVAAGLAMMLGVTVPFFGRSTTAALWLVMLGWFIASAARRSYRASVIELSSCADAIGRSSLAQRKASRRPTSGRARAGRARRGWSRSPAR